MWKIPQQANAFPEIPTGCGIGFGGFVHMRCAGLPRPRPCLTSVEPIFLQQGTKSSMQARALVPVHSGPRWPQMRQCGRAGETWTLEQAVWIGFLTLMFTSCVTVAGCFASLCFGFPLCREEPFCCICKGASNSASTWLGLCISSPPHCGHWGPPWTGHTHSGSFICIEVAHTPNWRE